MLRSIVRAALTAVFIPIASSFVLAQTPGTAAGHEPQKAMLPATTHYTSIWSPALTAAVTPLLDVENERSAPMSR